MSGHKRKRPNKKGKPRKRRKINNGKLDTFNLIVNETNVQKRFVVSSLVGVTVGDIFINGIKLTPEDKAVLLSGARYCELRMLRREPLPIDDEEEDDDDDDDDEDEEEEDDEEEEEEEDDEEEEEEDDEEEEEEDDDEDEDDDDEEDEDDDDDDDDEEDDDDDEEWYESMTRTYNIIKSECKSQPTCMICQSKFKNGVEARSLPCFHHFHTKCIDRWLNKNQKCPLCNKKVSDLHNHEKRIIRDMSSKDSKFNRCTDWTD